MVGTAPEWALPALFSHHLLRSLINQSKKDDRFLHAAAIASLKQIQTRIQQDSLLETMSSWIKIQS